MEKTTIKVGNQNIVIQAEECSNGDLKVGHGVEQEDGQITEWQITCRCTGGKTITKVCPSWNAQCDCSHPQNPVITC